MTEIRFYHLQSTSLDRALPQIVAKAYGGGRRVVIKTSDAARVEHINNNLWVHDAATFIPHGSAADGGADRQPVWITDTDENPNGADVLILTDSTTSELVKDFALCCDIFDGRDETALEAARGRWKIFKDGGFQTTYWQQTAEGGWEKKAG